ncbi:MAG: hypothetical protein ACI9GM_000563 [Salibacteraceae bacterium]|jgi:hypothetical protein
MGNSLKYKSLKEFYPYYLTEHQNFTCRVLHFVGTSLLFVIMGVAVGVNNYTILWLLPGVGYGFAWVGHFFYEKNKPATFQYPLYSLISDFKLFWDILRRKEKFKV